MTGIALAAVAAALAGAVPVVSPAPVPPVAVPAAAKPAQPVTPCFGDRVVWAPTLAECLPDRAGGGKLMVVNLQDGTAHWYLVEPNGARPLVAPPVEMSVVDTVAVSPDGRFLAVVSVGEGHPVLDVLDLARVLASDNDDRPLASVNPYPGWITVDAWRDGVLAVTSDRPLPDCCDLAGAFHGDTILESPRTFLLDPTTSSFR
jgi:hypothetical protein